MSAASIKPFETTEGPKQSCRDLICDVAGSELDQIKKVFTLPSREALCYHTFTKRYPKAKIACVEREQKICETLWDQGIDCTKTTVREYCNERKRPEQHHDIVFLDYYSFLSEDILNDVRAFLANDNILHPGKPFVLALTLAKGMRVHKDATLSALQTYVYDGERTGVQNDLDAVASALTGMIACDFLDFRDVRLAEAVEYRASSNSAQMYFVVFVITK